MNNLKRYINLVVFISLLLSNLVGPLPRVTPARAESNLRSDALVLVNSASPGYTDYTRFIQPYLDHFGVPYAVLDISATAVTTDINPYAVIIVGHKGLDPSGVLLDSGEQQIMADAVNNGAGLLNFDNDLSDSNTTARYAYVQSIFTFGYNTQKTGSDVVFADPALNYIIARHTNGQTIATNVMTLAGVTLPADVTVLASTGTQPLVAVTTYGAGRAVQFGSYDWISHSVKGPLWGLDDLFWRSIVWAARKPFVMQGLPPFVTMRMDDTSGPLWWIHAANDYGFVPWAGVFTNDIDTAEAADLKGLVDSGKATTSIHAFNNGTSRFFYFDHNNGRNFDDATIASYYNEATQWFADREITIGKYATPHYYEIGSNAFTGLQNWGIKYISTNMDPGQLESSSPWMMAGPFRLHETGNAYERNQNVYYADYLPTQPDFFNCITEIRDVTGYEWLGNGRTSVPDATADGIEWAKRPLDAMAIADLFSHEYTFVGAMSETDWRTTLQGITSAIASYNPMYVSRDYACAYARAAHDSNITSANYDPATNSIAVNLSGTTDMPTKFYTFSETAGQIVHQLVDVPTFNGTTLVSYTIPGQLATIEVSPNPADVIAGTTQQFTALGKDADGNPIPNLTFTWSVVNGGGTINSSGLFTAGVTPGTYSNTVRASFGTISGTATVNVTEAVLHHFSFDNITSPQYAGIPAAVTLRARDATNNPVVSFNGTVNLTASAGTIQPATATLVNGVWSGTVTLQPVGTGIIISAEAGGITGASSAFDVTTMRQCPCSIWEGSGTPQNANTTDSKPIEVGVKFRSDVSGYILGLKFYKGTANSGTHTGHLWSSSGTLLAEAEFTNESASGWQQVLFSQPVAVEANTTYVASYFSPSGYYAQDDYFFGSRASNVPLHALKDGEDGPNGVYRYDTTGFPNLAWTAHTPNYWVDVIFDNVAAREYSIWNNTGTPANASASDSQPIEVGVKFLSSTDGKLLGLRYYKGAGVTGTHTGHLWSSTGTLLGTVEFANETEQGWQEARFATPVPVYANTTYVASYFSPDGYFAITSGGLANAVSSPPLKALANGEQGPNGVYNYGSSGFPTEGSGANYWVDLVFTPSAVPDITAPVVSSVSPAANASGVAALSNVTATFSEPLNAATVSGSTFQLYDAQNQLVPVVVTYNVSTRTAVLDPQSALAYSATYTAQLTGGAGGISDVAGNVLAQNYTWTFTTSAPPPPPPDEGPGGPILVISSAANPFGRYYTEILRTEGLNAFYAMDITNVTAQTLTGYDVVILGEMSLTADQVNILTNWVEAGGNLIAMRPDKQLAALLGLADANGVLSNQYLRINTSVGLPGSGLTGETIQFHGSADLYTTGNDTTVLAALYSNATTVTTNPAVTLVSVGTSGGQAAAFTYDLARSVVYTRQGNPDWAAMERDSNAGGQQLIRSSDKFYGPAAGDIQPDWIDFSKIQIPQADEQQRLLANLILRMNADRKPLPRFWYFPRGEKAVIVMTGDDHNSSGTDDQWEYFKSVSPAGCSVDNWECIRGTSYVYTGNAMSDAQAAAYTAQGFEVALHPDTSCGNFTPDGLDQLLNDQLAAFATRFPSVPAPTTQRTHCIAFSDWDSQPIYSSKYGIRLDTNYYYWPDAWIQNRPGLFTGSGMIMRFAKLDGTLIDSFQAVTQMTDESGMSYPQTAIVLMDNALGPLGYYGAFTTNMHTDYANHPSGFPVIQAAMQRGVPVVSAKQMLTWLDGRNASTFQDLTWNGTNLNFTISVGAGANGLQAMLPKLSGGADLLNLTRGGSPVPYAVETIKGVEYAVFNAAAGSYNAAYGVDTSSPVISAVTVAPGTDNTALVTWTTDEPATSRIEYGIDPANLNLNASSAALVTSHSLNLTGLAPNTTYYYQIISVDEAGNPTTYPDGTIAQFTTPAMTLADSTAANFAAGTPGTCVIDPSIGDGAVRLPMTVEEGFDGSGLPSGWSSAVWTSGGTAAISGGLLTVDGASARYDTLLSAGKSIEFVATFGGTSFQHVGFGGGDITFGQEPWAMFSTHNNGTALYARVSGSTSVDYQIPNSASFLGTPHRYRIDWKTDGFDFYIDGAIVSSQPIVIASSMRAAASDYQSGGQSLAVDWLRMPPYQSPCTFTSRVFDAGELVTWSTLAWTGSSPAGTSLAFSYRTGATNDLSSYAWTPISGGSPATLTGSSRYIQYQAVLSSTDGAQSPVLEDVVITSQPGGETEPPTITSRTPAANATGIAVGSSVSVTFSEPMDASTITAAALRLRANGAGADVPAAVSYSGVTATLAPTSALEYETTYTVTVAGAVADLAGNPLGTDATWSFTTEDAPIPTLADTTAADFNAGTPGTCAVDPVIGDGAVRLALPLSESFSGNALPAGWTKHIWPDGAAPVIGGGLLTVNGSEAFTTATYGSGQILEFQATFAAAPYQTVGFAGNDIPLNEPPWLQFGTGSDGAQVYARIRPVGAANDEVIPLGAQYLGSPHTFRIEWNANGALFFIDGSQVAESTRTFTTDLHVVASDYAAGGAAVTVDSVSLYPYASPCAFTSRVMDAGQPVNWSSIAWTSSVPSGTNLALSARYGSTLPLDGADWIAVSGNTPQALAGNGRYIQYRAVLSSTDPRLSPNLQDVTITYAAGADTTPPVISNRTAAAQSPTTAEVTWNTNELADAQVLYGTEEGALSKQASETGLRAAHTIPLTDLMPNTTYYYRVTSKDAANNSVTEPPVGTPPASFTTPEEIFTLTDTTTTDFNSGTGTCAVDDTIGNGALRLPLTVDESFIGTALPSGWSGSPWPSAGSVTVSGGQINVDGAKARIDTLFSAGRTLEFTATFRAETFQHAGFAGGNTYEAAPIVMFSTRGSTNTLYTTIFTGSYVDVAIPNSAALIGTPHRYRIDWKITGVDFYVDGTLVDSRATVITEQMRAAISDYNNTAIGFSVDSMTLTPYISPCAFTSRIFDAGAKVDWQALTRTGSLPAGTSATYETRSGDTATPDATWSEWASIASEGGIASPSGRYLEYRVTLASDGSATPVVEEVSLSYSAITQATHSIALVAGWNLVSFNLIPEDSAPASVLSSIEGKYTLVYAWDASGATSGNWLKYDNIPYSEDGLTAITEKMGFWIHMNEAATLVITGTIPVATEVALSDNAGGWNLVGYPSAVNGSLPSVMQDHGVQTDFTLVYAYHAPDTTDPWKLFDRGVPAFGNDLSEMAPGWGYWVFVSADRVWQVGYTGP